MAAFTFHQGDAERKTATARVIRFPTERREARRLVDVAGLIEAFGFSRRYWAYRVAEGLPAHRWGRRLRFSIDEVERWMDAAGRSVRDGS
jgi:hypothetical protein